MTMIADVLRTTALSLRWWFVVSHGWVIAIGVIAGIWREWIR